MAGLALVLMAITLDQPPSPEAQGVWQPTLDDVTAAEREVVLPPKARPIADYERYYSGVIVDGRKLLKAHYKISFRNSVGIFFRAPVAILIPRNPPPCIQINLTFDLRARTTDAKCREL